MGRRTWWSRDGVRVRPWTRWCASWTGQVSPLRGHWQECTTPDKGEGFRMGFARWVGYGGGNDGSAEQGAGGRDGEGLPMDDGGGRDGEGRQGAVRNAGGILSASGLESGGFPMDDGLDDEEPSATTGGGEGLGAATLGGVPTGVPFDYDAQVQRAHKGYTPTSINTGVNDEPAGARRPRNWQESALDDENLHTGLAQVLALPWPDTGAHGEALHADRDEPGFGDEDEGGAETATEEAAGDGEEDGGIYVQTGFHHNRKGPDIALVESNCSIGHDSLP
ncbi:unnamed protein product [Closterium sp. Yama58-4]|nr:unnamed protein product [Closterium sp. Yama58-4]